MIERHILEQLHIDAFDGRHVNPEHVRDLIAQVTLNDTEAYCELLWIVGRAELTEFRDFVEVGLRSEKPDIVSAAINTIFGLWTHAEHDYYVSSLTRFAKGVSWDEYDDVRLKALSNLGSYLQYHDDDALLEYLHGVARDDAERDLTRGAAYRGLALALNRKWHELPGKPGEAPFESDGWELFDEAARRLGK